MRRLLWLVLLMLLAAAPAWAQGNCSGYADLVVGERGRVLPGSANNVRAEPDTNARRIGQIPGGATFTVEDGPVCSDGYTWWLVEYGGIYGWTADGADGEAWLEPLEEARSGGNSSESSSDSTSSDSGALSYDDVISSELNGAPEEWTFDAAAGDVVIIAMSSDDFDTYLELIGPNGSIIDENDDYDGLNSQIGPIGLEDSGTYTIVARGYSSRPSGDYVLSLTSGSSDTVQGGGTIGGDSPSTSAGSQSGGGSISGLTRGNPPAIAITGERPVLTGEEVGYQIFVISERQEQDAALVIDMNGTVLRQIPMDADCSHNYIVSPDGQSFTCTLFLDGGRGLMRVSIADGTSQLLYSTAGFIQGVDWSPEGEQIAFVVDESDDTAVYTMNADGSGVSRLSDVGELQEYGVNYTSDGSEIWVWAWDDDYEDYFYRIDAVTGDVLGDQIFGFQAEPSPDSAWIAMPEGETYRIMVARADGSGGALLPSGDGVSHSQPSWSPDGRWIVYNSAITHEIEDLRSSVHLSRADGTGYRLLLPGDYLHSYIQFIPGTEYPLDGDEQVVSVESDSAIWYTDDFEVESAWSAQPRDDGSTLEVADGALTVQSAAPAGDYSFMFTTPLNNRYGLLSEPFQVDFDFTVTENDGGAYIQFSFNDREMENPLDEFRPERNFLFVRLLEEGWRIDADGGYFVGSQNLTGTYPSTVTPFDGDTHSAQIIVRRAADQVRVIVLLDEIEVADVIIPGVADTWEWMDPAFHEIYGTWFMGAGVLAPSNSRSSAAIRIESFQLAPYRGVALAEGQGLGTPTVALETDNERLNVMTPEGWLQSVPKSVSDIYESFDNIYIVTMYNSEQGITGAANEMGFTVYEPVYVMEMIGVLDTDSESPETVLTAFLNAQNISAGSAETLTLDDGREAARIDVDNDTWLAFRSSDETVVIMQVMMADGQREAMLPTGLAIAATLDYPAPSRDLDGAEQVVSDFLLMLNSGEYGMALTQMCAEDVAALAMAGMALSGALDTGSEDISPYIPPADQPTEPTFVIDDSGRYIETVSLEGSVAIVRAFGNVGVYHDDGRVEIIPHDEFFFEPLRPFFTPDTYRVERSGGVWQLCSGAFTFGS